MRAARLRAVGAAALLAAAGAWFGSGCQTIEPVAEIGTAIGVSTGSLTVEEADSIRRGAHAVGQTFKDFTAEQEYYVGRAVAAGILQTYRPLSAPAATRYLNQLGQALALASSRPETFVGYRFLLLDTDEVNAFAAPGGLVLVTRGMVKLCTTEDQLAAVLAHEIAHVTQRHGLSAIKQSRVVEALTVLATEGARQFGSEDLVQLTDLYEGSIDDITQTLLTTGYARALEREADTEAAAILTRVGYDPMALAHMLTAMEARWDPRGPGFAKTHPSPSDRMAEVKAMLDPDHRAPPALPVRKARFFRAIGKL